MRFFVIFFIVSSFCVILLIFFKLVAAKDENNKKITVNVAQLDAIKVVMQTKNLLDDNLFLFYFFLISDLTNTRVAQIIRVVMRSQISNEIFDSVIFIKTYFRDTFFFFIQIILIWQFITISFLYKRKKTGCSLIC